MCPTSPPNCISPALLYNYRRVDVGENKKSFLLCFDVIQQSTEENMQKYKTSLTNTNHHLAI